MTDTQDLIQRIAEAKEHALLYGGLTTAFWPYQRFAITVGELFDALETAQAEIERLRNEKSGPYFGHYQDALGKIARLEGHIKHIGNDALRTENAELRARLAELAKQKPCASMPRCALNGAEDCTCGVNGPCEGLTDVYLAAGASPEPSALQAENANLITALAVCRGAFPVPYADSRLYDWYVGAMADPLAVPDYVKACVGASPVQPSQCLQSVADALTIEQLNDKVERLMAVQPSQAGELLDHEQKAEIVSNWFSDEDMQSRAMQMLGDIEQAIAAINAKESGK